MSATRSHPIADLIDLSKPNLEELKEQALRCMTDEQKAWMEYLEKLRVNSAQPLADKGEKYNPSGNKGKSKDGSSDADGFKVSSDDDSDGFAGFGATSNDDSGGFTCFKAASDTGDDKKDDDDGW